MTMKTRDDMLNFLDSTTAPERDAIDMAVSMLADYGMEFPMPWHGDCDDYELERAAVLVLSLRGYKSHKTAEGDE